MRVAGRKTALFMLWIFFSSVQCTSEPISQTFEGQGPVRISGPVTGASNEQILNFEDAMDWESTTGTVASSGHHVRGAAGLFVRGSGWIEIVSAPMSTLANVDDSMAVSIRLPAEQPEPYWYGQVALLIDLPSQGLNHRWIGELPLTGLPLEQFVTLEFDLPSDVVVALQQNYTDLRFKLVLNVPYNATGEYVLDSLRFEDLDQGPVIRLGSERDPSLLQERSSFATFGDSMLLLGEVLDGGGVKEVSIQVNGGGWTAVTLDADNKFESLLSLNASSSQFVTSNELNVRAVDIDNNAATTTVAIEVTGLRAPREIVVLFAADAGEMNRQAILAKIGGSVVSRITSRLVLIEVTAGTELQTVDTLLTEPFVRAALPNFPLTPTGVPNDIRFSEQWYLNDIGAVDAWDVSTGSDDIIAAVLDTGVDYDAGAAWEWRPCEVLPGGGIQITDFNVPSVWNIWLNERECCEVPPCAIKCFPSKPQGDVDTCPRSDLNGDGCPGVCDVDDDGDGASDFKDPDVMRIFSNGKDDDGDGLIDEKGPGGVSCNSVTPGQMQTAAASEDCDGAANDDDENGYPDDCRGFQFGRQEGMQEDYFGNPVAPNDPADLDGGFDSVSRQSVTGHGTMVAFMLGQMGENCYMGAGVAQRVKIMPLGIGRHIWRDGTRSSTTQSDFFSVLEAYEYASENGADITNASLSVPCNPVTPGDPNTSWDCPWGSIMTGDEAKTQMTLLLSETGSQHVLHVSGAGDDGVIGMGTNLDTTPRASFPQGVQLSNIAVVSASRRNHDPGGGTNYGATTVSMAAPGRDLAVFGGTSASAPQVAGAAILLMDAFPELRGDPQRLIAHLEANVTPYPQWAGLVRSGGILNVNNAIHTTPSPGTMFTDDSHNWLPRSGRELETNDVDLVDVDGDGDLDMLEFPSSPLGTLRSVRLLINENGKFHDRTETQWPAEKVSFADADYGDINGDGAIDIITAGYYSPSPDSANQNQVYINDGNGVFSNGTSASLPADLAYTRSIALCDLDSDGNLDLVTGNFRTILDLTFVSDRVFMNNGAGVFTEETSSRLLNVYLPYAGAPNKIACAELSEPLSNVCDVSKEDCRLCSNPGLSLSEIAAGGKVADLTACTTIRNSVSPEIIVAGSQGSVTRYFENQGGGVFMEETAKLNLPNLGAGRQESDVEVADFDNDGALDLMFVTVRGLRNFMLQNNGDGTFSDALATQSIFNEGDWAREVEVADFDNNDTQDIIILRGDPNAIVPGYHSYYRNDGSGIFTKVPVGIDTSYLITTDADVGDIDNDGDIDMVIGNTGSLDQVMRNNLN